MDISDYRKEIDMIDNELVKLFERRLEVVTKVGEYKKENNLPILNESREVEVINKNVSKLTNMEYEPFAKQFFEDLMRTSRNFQHELIDSKKNSENILVSGKKQKKLVANKEERIGYFGVEGSFTEEAMFNYFGEECTHNSYEEFEELFIAITEGKIKYGVVPIENSSTGAITDVYDLLNKYGLYICGEQCLRIRQHLIGVKGTTVETIKEIYSHPQGFKQSSEFLKDYSEWIKIPYLNTSRSVKLVKESNELSKAAIGSKRAANIYGLEILKENINNESENHTRFLIIGKYLEHNNESNKISVVFSLEDEAGTLYELLRSFANNNINLMKIESRPIKGHPWKYLLYVDFQGNISKIEVKDTLAMIENKARYFKLLGNYCRDSR